MTDPFIKIDNLVKSYKWGKIKAVDGVTLSINRGEVFGLIGPNGAGKTTIMGCLLALLKPKSGTITIDGKSPFDLDIKRITGFLPERPYFDSWMTVKQFLWYHHQLAERPVQLVDQEVKEALELVELEADVVKKKVKELSRGMLQRVGLAQAMIGKPQLCFFDEPTSGMDPLGFMLVRKLLLKCKEDGVTVILNSHHLDEVEKVCDRVAFIRKGKIELIDSLGDSQEERKKTLVLSWIEDDNPDKQNLVKETVESSGLKLLQCDQSMARILLSEKKEAAELITSLSASGLSIFEATWERKSLVELFVNDSNANEEKGKSKIEIPQEGEARN